MERIEVKIPRRKWYYRLHKKKLEFEFKKRGKAIIDIELKISRIESYCQSIIHNYIYRYILLAENNVITLILIDIKGHI